MNDFDDIQDVRDWLAPLDYAGFWEAVGPMDLFAPGDRAHCARLIAAGTAETVMLDCLRAMARQELTDLLGLEERLYEPVTAQYLRRTH